jgi:site-specific recombinase XerD
VHRWRAAAGCATSSPVFVRLGRFPGAEPPEPLSAQAVHKLVRTCALAAGVPARLAHPHALRTYWATSLLEDGVPIHRVSNRLGHADLRTTSRYAADHPDRVEDVVDVLDRRHQARRARR